MSIQNTEKLYQNRADLMNSGLRAFHVTAGESNSLAKFYGLGVRTVQRWFATYGQQYRRCVPSFVWTATPDGDTTGPGYRIVQMFDADNPSGYGTAAPKAHGGSDLQNLRLRCFLAAALGVNGGLVRIPIYTGPPKELVEPKGSLAECVYRINQIYTGGATSFLYRAWTGFEITQEIEGWTLTIRYNVMTGGDSSNAEEIPYDENLPA